MNEDSDRQEEGSVVEIPLSKDQRDMVLEHMSADAQVEGALKGADEEGRRLIVRLEEEDWEAIAGDLSVAANHTEDRTLQRKLDALIETIEDALLFDEEEEDDE